MPIFKDHLSLVCKMAFVLCVSVVLVAWLKKDSLQEYAHQNYSDSPFLVLWRGLDWLPDTVIADRELAFEAVDFHTIAQLNEAQNAYFNRYFFPSVANEDSIDTVVQNQAWQASGQSQSIQPNSAPTPNTSAHLDAQQKQRVEYIYNLLAQTMPADEASKSPNTSTNPNQDSWDTIHQTSQHQGLTEQKVHILAHQKVFFAGDSMMQGVAPWVMQDLQKQYGIHGINLSKQSTGLNSAKFFDWPATIEQTLDKEKNIGLLVVFLGPNDPSGMKDSEKGGYAEFASERWTALYQKKIDRILKTAEQHHVQVIWLTPPLMKKPSLDKQMAQMRPIINEALTGRALAIDSKTVLYGKTDTYSDVIMIDGKPVKVRTADGVHFTSVGQKLLAAAVMDKIAVS